MGDVRVFGKVPGYDIAFVIVAVTVVTVSSPSLATAVVLGILMSLVFAWEQAKHISVISGASMTKIARCTNFQALYFSRGRHGFRICSSRARSR